MSLTKGNRLHIKTMIRQITLLSLFFWTSFTLIERETLPVNGQTDNVRFFVNRPDLCRFEASEFNLRFKKCRISIEFGKAIPEILLNYNQDGLGMKRLYELFCVKKDNQRLSLFNQSSSKIDFGDITEKYPFSAFQKIDCPNLDKVSPEEKELDKEVSQELNTDAFNKISEDLKTENDSIVLVEFTTQPTIQQMDKDKFGDQKNHPDILGEMDVLFTGEGDQPVNRDSGLEWVNDVVGGYYLEETLDYSHLQDNSFVFVEGEHLSKHLTSIEARPTLWMVLFEWEDAYHSEKTINQHYKELKQMINSQKLGFTIKRLGVTEIWANQLSKNSNKKLKRQGYLSNERFVFKTTQKHIRADKRRPSVKEFFDDLEFEMNGQKSLL